MSSHKARNTMCVRHAVLKNEHLQRPEPVECPAVDGFDFGTALQELYPILATVFKYLPADDLKQAGRVNNVWEDYASREFHKRKSCGSFFIYYNSGLYKLHKSSNFEYIDVMYGFVFGSAKLKQYRNICFHLDDQPDTDIVANALKTNLLGSAVNTFGYLVGSILPIKNKITCSGIVLPKIPNLVIEEYNGKDLIINISKALKRGLQLKALMYFSDQRSNSHESSLKKFLKYLLTKQNQRSFALGGGLVIANMEDYYIEARNIMKAVRSGFQYVIAFLYPADEDTFDAHSIVIDDTDHYSTKLSEAKEHISLKKHSTAILFQCSGLTIPHLEEEFRYHFPKVHFTGVTVEGEIGWDTYDVNKNDGDSPKKKCKSEPIYLHAYSVVILFLSWD